MSVTACGTTVTLDRSDFGFDDNEGRFVVEPGEIDVFAGDSPQAAMEARFDVRGHRPQV